MGIILYPRSSLLDRKQVCKPSGSWSVQHSFNGILCMDVHSGNPPVELLGYPVVSGICLYHLCRAAWNHGINTMAGTWSSITWKYWFIDDL